MGSCTVAGCETNARINGLCPKHASRMRRRGTTDLERHAHAPPEERFWRKVEKAGPDECWRWTAGGHKVYGSFMLGGRGSRRMLAHRYSYELHHGPIPEGMVVMHSCDNPLCVNPAHLRTGSLKDNAQDMKAKGRGRYVSWPGEANGNAVLNEDMVRVIRASKLPPRRLAAALGISEGSVHDVLKGRRWTHLK